MQQQHVQSAQTHGSYRRTPQQFQPDTLEYMRGCSEALSCSLRSAFHSMHLLYRQEGCLQTPLLLQRTSLVRRNALQVMSQRSLVRSFQDIQPKRYILPPSHPQVPAPYGSHFLRCRPGTHRYAPRRILPYRHRSKPFFCLQKDSPGNNHG